MTAPSHIAIYLPSLRGGGAERVMVNLANAIAARGHRVDLVLSRAEGPYLRDVSGNVTVLDLGARRTLAGLPALVRYLRRARPDAFLSVLSNANAVALVARWLSGVSLRLVVSERSTFSVQRRMASTVKEKLLHWCLGRLYRSADAIVTVSQAAADDLVSAIRVDPTLVHPIHNFIDLGRVDAAAAPGNEPDASTPFVLAAGRLTNAKDFGVLMRAFARLHAERGMRLVIAGEGELRSALQELAVALGIAGSVSMPGFLADPYAHMRQADLFVLSSAWEGFPNVLLEAMACGARVVSTDCPSGPAEILEGGKWGSLVPVGDVAALHRAMVETLDNPMPPDVRRRAADFGVDRAVDAYLAVLSGPLRQDQR